MVHAGEKDLGVHLLQVITDSLSISFIQFGRQIIHEKNTPPRGIICLNHAQGYF